MKSIITLCLLLVLTCGFAFSQKKRAADPCANPQTQFEMNQCAGKDYKTADAALNQVYQRLVNMLDDEERAQLKEAQTAWIKYRDLNCDFVGDQFKGGTMRPMVYANCLADMTRKRTTELRTQIKERNL